MTSIAEKTDDGLIKKIIHDALQRGCLYRREHFILTSAMLSQLTLSDIVRSQINRVLDSVRVGRIQLKD